MTNDAPNGTPSPDAAQSGRYKTKSPGRVAWMKQLHAEGRASTSGGPRPKHGIRAVEERIRRGLDPGTPLAALHAERRAAYIADLGGEQNMSNMEAGICDRLADLDLVRGLLNAQRETAKRMTAVNLLNHVQAVTRNALAYVQAVKAVGPGRRQVDTDKTIIVKRYADSVVPTPDNGQEEAKAEVVKLSGAQEE